MKGVPPSPKVSAWRLVWWGALGSVLATAAAGSSSVTLAWDANSEPDVAGYKLNYGAVSGVYTTTVDVGEGSQIGDEVRATLSGLATGTYYIAVTAYSDSGLESAVSNEVEYSATGFAAWQLANAVALGGETAPSDNPEGDEYDNALEYALMLEPGSGVNSGAFCVELNPASGKIEASYRRPAGAGVTYTLEVALPLGGVPGWGPWPGAAPAVVDHGDGSETVTYPDLEAAVGTEGMARLRVELDGDASGAHYTPLFGWDTQPGLAGSQTCSFPYAAMSAFSGSLAAGEYDPKLALLPAAGAGAALAKGREYHLEFMSGPFAGHRFDLAQGGATATHVALDRLSPRNTLAPVPAALEGAFAIRPTLTLRELVDPGLAAASDDPEAGDRLFRFDGAKWKSFWAYDGSGAIPAQWTDVDNDELLDAGDTVIAPDEGLYLRASGSYLPVTRVGVVREWPFACPLRPGFNLVGGGFPVDQSPLDRAMHRDDGDGFQDWFTASNDPLSADQCFLWLGDGVAGAQGYRTYFRVDLGIAQYDHWADQTNSNLTNVDAEKVFARGRACFVRSIAGHDRADPEAVWMWPAPWVAVP